MVMDGFSSNVLDDNIPHHCDKHTSGQLNMTQHWQPGDDGNHSEDDLARAEPTLAANFNSGTPDFNPFNAGI